MSTITISAIKADVGGYVGHGDVHPSILEVTRDRVEAAIADSPPVDRSVGSCGDDINLVLTHERGID